MTDKVINMPDGHKRQVLCVFSTSKGQEPSRRSYVEQMMRRHFLGCTQSSKSCFVALHNGTPVLFLGYHIWLLHRNEGLSRRALHDRCWIRLPKCSKSKKRRSTTILLCYICLKHFTVQKCWKLWSSFLLLFKEKINAVITSVRFPSWKHGHEIRLLGFHFDGGMS